MPNVSVGHSKTYYLQTPTCEAFTKMAMEVARLLLIFLRLWLS